jgi:hypothetical protein
MGRGDEDSRSESDEVGPVLDGGAKDLRRYLVDHHERCLGGGDEDDRMF